MYMMYDLEGMLLYMIIVGPAFLLAMLAQFWVKSAYNRYSRIGNRRGLSGAQAAAQMLRNEGIVDVTIEMSRGMLSDHYDPTAKTLRLSPDVHNGRSLASVGIAAHEAGHAIQHAQGYAPLWLRSTIVPVANIGSQMAMPLFGLGIFLAYMGGTGIGMIVVKGAIVLFAGVVLFQLITLPVEFDASSRAKAALANQGMLSGTDEMDGVASVLNAAAMTYVAAAVQAILTLLYFLIRAGLLGGRDD